MTINSLNCGLACGLADTVGVGVAVGGGKVVSVAAGSSVSIAAVVEVLSIEIIDVAVGCMAWVAQPKAIYSSIKIDNANRLNILLTALVPI